MIKSGALVALMGLSTLALAQTPSATGPAGDASGGVSTGASERAPFEQLDSDKNGYLSRTEAESSAWLKGNFNSADSNGDGRVTMAEYNAAAKTGK